MLEFLGSLALIGWLGWSSLSVLFILIWIFVANDKYGSSTFCFLLFWFTVWFFFKPALQYVFENPWNILWYSLCYIGIGSIIWSPIRWGLFVAEKREEDRQWEKKERKAPDIENHWDDVIAWSTFWPWSMLWTMLDDVLRRIQKAIAYSLKGLFNWISKSVYNR